jgi:hypothetical protein
MDVPGERLFLCIAEPPAGGHGFAAFAGALPTAPQLEALSQVQVQWLHADLPFQRAQLPDSEVVVGRIRLDDPTMTVDSAPTLVDQALAQGVPDLIVLDDRYFSESSVADIPGVKDGPEMMLWLKTRGEALCAAAERARQHCQDCQVGISTHFSSREFVFWLFSELAKDGRSNQCFFDFAEQVFENLDPAVLSPEYVPPLGKYLPQFIPDTLPCPTCMFYLARIGSFLEGAIERDPVTAASQVVSAALHLRLRGFDVVIVPHSLSDVDGTAQPQDAKDPLLAAISTLEHHVGAGQVASTDQPGLLSATPEQSRFDSVMYVSLAAQSMEGAWATDVKLGFVQDVFGVTAATVTTDQPPDGQLLPLSERTGPFYLVVNPSVHWPTALVDRTENLFQNAWVPNARFYPSGAMTLNLDADPELEWISPFQGVTDPVEGGLYRLISTYPDIMSTLFDADGDGDLDLITAYETGLGLDASHHVYFNHGDLWPYVPPLPEDPDIFSEERWMLHDFVGTVLAQDLTGDGVADLLGLSDREVIVYESSATPGTFIERRTPVEGNFFHEDAARVMDIDADGLFDILVVNMDWKETRPQGIGVSAVLIQRAGKFVASQIPCGIMVATLQEIGHELLTGPGLLCANDVSLNAWTISGDVLMQTWSVQIGDLSQLATILPYRAHDQATTQILLSSDSGIEIGTARSGGFSWELLPTAAQVVTDTFATSPTARTTLTGHGIAFDSPEAAAAFLPPLPEWNPWPASEYQSLFGDYDDDGRPDVFRLEMESEEWKEVNEVGKPHVAWRETAVRVAIGYDFLTPGFVFSPVGPEIVVRFPTAHCMDDPSEGLVKDAPWNHSVAVGQFDGHPGDDLFIYSPLRHLNMDMVPAAHLWSGHTGQITEIDVSSFFGLEMMGDKTSCTFASMAVNLDNDGIDDVILWDRRQGILHLMCSDGKGSLAASPRFNTAPLEISRIMGTTDVNHDGNMDIMAVYQQQLVFYLGNGRCEIAGTLEYTLGINTQFHNPYSCDDFDGDGQHECFFECLWELDPDRTETHCLAKLPSKSGRIPEDTWIGLSPPLPSASARAQKADFNGDGVFEILLDGSVVRLKASRLSFAGTFLPKPVQILGDINGDGTDDALSDDWQVLYGRRSTE